MDKETTPFVEITDNRNYVRIAPDVPNVWDKSIPKLTGAEITFKAGGFTGNFKATVAEGDFGMLKKQLSFIYERRIDEASFETFAKNVRINFNMQENGHCTALCTVGENITIRNMCSFGLLFDQSYLPEVIRQLENILEKFQ